jgi:peptidoglycan/LPS O-acetylase OafA/YrhL
MSTNENPGPRQETVPSLYLLRGLAALTVCCFHYLGNVDFKIPAVNYFFIHGFLGVDLFFMISGFVIPYAMYQKKYTWKKFPKFMLKRSVRIEPPYIMSFLLLILLWKILAYADGPKIYEVNWKQFGLHFFYLNQYFGYKSYMPVYWTLAIEFQFYLLVGLLYPAILSRNKFISLGLLIISCAVCWVQVLHYNWFIFQYLFMFISGILIFLYMIRHLSLKWFLVLNTSVLVMIAIHYGYDFLFVALLGTCGIILIRKRWKVTDFMGRISYSFYLTHIESGAWFMILVRDYVPNNFVLRIIGILFSILFATGFYYAFERPAFRLSKKIRYREKVA